ncbi:ribosomal protein S18-alanine N-acetyltransferase [Nocardioides pantholopis]|uniref:ribosomal protein S18-alanine N-acetyltransferase n=1 Tax=Nocardioides pantholopis TaxID=2483798 RepID=UPI000F08FF2A|nr:ribosomal protein S18-alanine N-acetyltransferase [Nocardioides pantholopis]
MIRGATLADADAVVALETENLGADAWPPGLVREGLAGTLPTVSYLVAEVDGELVGHAVASVVGDIAELQRIAVRPEHRRSGVASELLAEVVAAAVAGGAERLLLEVREDNVGAARFYAARGFIEIARRQRYYRDGATALVLARDLPAA